MDNVTVHTEPSFIQWNIILHLFVCMIAFLGSSLLTLLLVGVCSQKGFTAIDVKTNLSLFHMMCDLLMLGKDILILAMGKRGYELFCKISTRIGYVLVLGTVLNYILLALNHYCLHKSRRRKFYVVFLSRKNTWIAMSTTWIISTLWAVMIKFFTHKNTVANDLHYYACRGLLPDIVAILFNSFVCMALLLINLVYYRIYKNVITCLKERTKGLDSETQTIRIRMRSIRFSFITSLWISAIFGLTIVGAFVHSITITTDEQNLHTVLYIFFILPVQLIALIAHVMASRRSRRTILNCIQMVKNERKRRQTRVGIIVERIGGS